MESRSEGPEEILEQLSKMNKVDGLNAMVTLMKEVGMLIVRTSDATLSLAVEVNGEVFIDSTPLPVLEEFGSDVLTSTEYLPIFSKEDVLNKETLHGVLGSAKGPKSKE
ncbi:hypothetical protein INT47_006607 [Mucor saturninus]|uniref:Uncharacterized protein n=1 Tax=Mucor saturninus TaxID=64648 RepID=A0A8H7UWY6_9FUNG|nr:hypothetical protein INT47_006607 [Mucor saturninus]